MCTVKIKKVLQGFFTTTIVLVCVVVDGRSASAPAFGGEDNPHGLRYELRYDERRPTNLVVLVALCHELYGVPRDPRCAGGTPLADSILRYGGDLPISNDTPWPDGIIPNIRVSLHKPEDLQEDSAIWVSLLFGRVYCPRSLLTDLFSGPAGDDGTNPDRLAQMQNVLLAIGDIQELLSYLDLLDGPLWFRLDKLNKQLDDVCSLWFPS
jgi:hypothetical protein